MWFYKVKNLQSDSVMKTKNRSCLPGIRGWLQNRRSPIRNESGHAFIEGVFFMGILMLLVMLAVCACAGPFVGKFATWLGIVDHPLSFKESFAFTAGLIQFALGAVVFGYLFIEWPASVLNLNTSEYGPRPEFGKKWKVLGRHHYSRKAMLARNGFRIFAVIASVAIGYLVATTYIHPKLSPAAMMIVASMAALAPVSWVYAIIGLSCRPFRKFMTTRTVFIPQEATATA